MKQDAINQRTRPQELAKLIVATGHRVGTAAQEI